MSKVKKVFLGVGLLVLGCVSPSSQFCDVDTPCSDPLAPFCDIEGTVSGDSNRCIADVSTLACDTSSQCTGTNTEPVCNAVSAVCVQCWNDPNVDGDIICTQKDRNQPFCATSGACECDETSCADPSQSICDPVGKMCRGCLSHDDCASGVCDLQTGECIAEDTVAFIDPLGDGMSCTKNEPCQSLDLGVEVAVRDNKSVVFAHQGNYLLNANTVWISDLNIVGQDRDKTVFLHSLQLDGNAKLQSVTVSTGQVSLFGENNQVTGVTILDTKQGDAALFVASGTSAAPSYISDVSIRGCDDHGLDAKGVVFMDKITIDSCHYGAVFRGEGLTVENIGVTLSSQYGIFYRQ